MLKDIEDSKQYMSKYHKQHPIETQSFELNVNLCTVGTWPSGAIVPVKISIFPSIVCASQSFMQFYHNQYSAEPISLSPMNRMLLWLKRGQINYYCKAYCAAFETAVREHFDDDDEFDVENVMEELNYFNDDNIDESVILLSMKDNEDTKEKFHVFIPRLIIALKQYMSSSSHNYIDYTDMNGLSSRRINFQMNKGTADVSVQFNAKCEKILVVSTYQMLILLLFNYKTTYTFKEMLDKTGIYREDLAIAALSLAHPKVKVMRKSPNTKDVTDDHKFQLNPNFANNRQKITIPTLEIKVNKKPEPNVNENIMRLRRHQIDAAIVRIMKKQKTLKHPDLVVQVVKQLKPRFSPKPVDIKKRIANLIDLEYLRRDDNERQLYHYHTW